MANFFLFGFCFLILLITVPTFIIPLLLGICVIVTVLKVFGRI